MSRPRLPARRFWRIFWTLCWAWAAMKIAVCVIAGTPRPIWDSNYVIYPFAGRLLAALAGTAWLIWLFMAAYALIAHVARAMYDERTKR